MRGDVIIFALIWSKLVYAGAIMGQGLSVSAALYSLTATALLAMITYVFRTNRQRWYVFVLNVFVSALLFADLLYFKYFGRPMSVYAFLQVKNLNGLGGSIEALWSWREWVVLLDVPLLAFWMRRQKFTRRPPTPWLRIAAHAVLAVMIVVGLYALSPSGVLRPAGERPGTQVAVDDVPDAPPGATSVQRFGPLGHHVVDALSFIRDEEAAEDPAAKEAISRWYTAHDVELMRSFGHEGHGSAKGMNVIMLQVESLQNFPLDLEIDGQAVTPTLREMKKHALYFPHFYSQTIEGNSSDAELLTQTSLYPAAHGATFYRFAGERYPSLAHMLRQEGYTVLAVHGDRGSYWNRDRMYPGLGLTPFYDLGRLKADEIIGMGLSDRSLFRQTVTLLKEAPEPFYAFVITLSSHLPFIIPEEEQTLKLPESMQGTIVGDYLQSIHYFDRALGAFLRDLQEEGLLERTLIVVYGDHDGLLLHKDREAMEAAFDRSIDQETWLKSYQPVPLLIYHVGWTGRTVETIGGEIDVTPTVADLLGIDAGRLAGWAMGRSLLDSRTSYAVLPGGDYSLQAAITPDGVFTTLPAWADEALSVADLIHRTRYFRDRRDVLEPPEDAYGSARSW
ncbi:MAG: LTA synthase family protein [Hydrogenibacillus sp.]|nr:LTA synthase family protein [Hydrogenibacillus sp.]